MNWQAFFSVYCRSFWHQISLWKSSEVTHAAHAGGVKCRCCMKIRNFLPIAGYISETIQDTHFTVKHSQEFIYDLWNGFTADNLEWPLKVIFMYWKPIQIQCFEKYSMHYYRATHMHSADYAVARCLSVCPSVRLSHVGILSTPLNISSFFTFR